MRHFSYLTSEQVHHAFELPPQALDTSASAQQVGIALGALLYTPATHQAIADNLLSSRWPGLTSTVLCLEDAIADGDVPAGEANLAAQLRAVTAALESGAVDANDLPLIFLRIRNPDHLRHLSGSLGSLGQRLAGIVLPKFSSDNGAQFLDALSAAQDAAQADWMVMPVLESPQIAYREQRTDELLRVAELLAPHRERVAAVRLGAADLSGLYGLRRSPEFTIYDLGVVRDVIADVVNVMARPEHNYVVSGPVWEYFDADEKLGLAALRNWASMHSLHSHPGSLAHAGLVREVLMDRANGITGKTVIHPSHVLPINALYTVSHDEYLDAQQILTQNANGGGAVGAASGGKMNEAKPHARWAERVLLRAQAFGVLRPHLSPATLLEMSQWLDLELAS